MAKTLFRLLFVCVVFKKILCAKDNRSRIAWPFEQELAAFPEYINQSETIAKYECTAELEELDLLSWYQIKEQRHILLSMVQNVDKLSNMTVTLDKTFEETDRDSVFYCIKEHAKKIVRWIAVSLPSEKITAIEPASVTIEPSTSLVYFDFEETMRFVCRGTKSIDGRKLTWYFENNAESTETDKDLATVVSHFEIAEHQEYDLSNNENVLELPLNSDHNLKRLFCAEDFSRIITKGDGTKKVIRFGQRAKSDTITLILENYTNTRTTSSRPISLTVILASLLTFTSILTVLLIIVIVKQKSKVKEFEKKERMWNRRPLETPNENTYDTVYSHGAGLKRKPTMPLKRQLN